MAAVVDLTTELDRRYANIRSAMAGHELDALIVSCSEYSGFEGAVTYLTGFQIVHRFAYTVVPADGEPYVVFPSEARYVGEHGTALVEQRFDPHPGAAIAAAAKDAGWRRMGVYGLDYVMTVRDYRPLEDFDIVPFDVEFDLARAVKSEAELESVRDSVRINRRGFEVWAEAYAPGRTAAEVMAVAARLQTGGRVQLASDRLVSTALLQDRAKRLLKRAQALAITAAFGLRFAVASDRQEAERRACRLLAGKTVDDVE